MTPRRALHWVTSSLLAVVIVFVPLAAATAREESPRQLWILSTRRAPGCDVQRMEQAELEYRVLNAGRTWTASDADAFHAADDPGVPTVFFIHGNQVDSCRAQSEGRTLQRALQGAAPGQPLRLVIWSWPASRIGGRIREDVRVKAARSDAESYYFARCLDRMDPRVPVGAVGHSFGARVIAGAMEMLAGGKVAGRSLPPGARPARRVRAVFVAAAMDNGWLLPGWRNGQALAQLDRLLVTQNGRDRVLKWYPLMYRRGGPEALGYTGPACPARLGPDRDKIEVLGLTCSVGKTHAWGDYLASSALRARLAWYAFLDEPPSAAPVDGAL
ncbi:MAG: hypothetical protein JW809_05315 [Pirellulales bacterium]|nr:hypothetical protein [Pirellulales bacterium]